MKKDTIHFLLQLKERSEQYGFCEVSFIKAGNPSRSFRRFYKSYLSKNFHAEMRYLENTRPKFNLKYFQSNGPAGAYRGNPGIIMAALHPYRHIETEKELKKSAYKIARYAWGKDYHIHLRKKLESILGQQTEYRIIIDSTPFPERYYARKAGLGFIGKNGMLIHPALGSYFFLTFVLLPQRASSKDLKKLENQYEAFNSLKKQSFQSTKKDIADWCGECNRCVQSCPTKALPGDGELDASRCISYWSIESKSEKIDLKKNIGKWIFGCDICQKVCPYNQKKFFTQDQEFAPHRVIKQIAQGRLTNLNESHLKGLALKRAGLKALQRNIEFH